MLYNSSKKVSKMKNKIFLILLFFVGVIVLLLSFTLITINQSRISEISLEKLNYQKQEKIAYFSNYMKEKTLILSAISNNKEFKNFIENNENKTVVENLFLTYCFSNKEIFQLRYLDENGYEIIRAENYTKPSIVLNESLQNKKTRYYFLDTMNKNRGEFYFSNIDLNKEHGKIQEPIIPTLRIATPVFHENERKGILILNINLNKFFNQLIIDPSYYVNLIYADGSIIISNFSKYNWSKDYKLKETIFDLYPFIPKDFAKNNNIEESEFFISKLISETKNEVFILLVHKENKEFLSLEKDLKKIVYFLLLITLLGIPAGYFISLYIEKIVIKKTTFENKLLESKLLNSVIDSTNDLIFYKDKDFKYLGCNKSFERFVGISRENIVGKDDFNLFEKKYAELFRKMDKKMLQENIIRENNEWLNYEGKDLYFQTKKIPFSYDNSLDVGILGISRDITKLHEQALKIKEQTFIDELTQIYNRKAYNNNIKNIIDLYNRYKEPFSIIMFDIDNFKLINDNYGHKQGDEVLYKIAQLAKKSIRKTDEIYRVGGEEFIIILRNIKIKDANSIAQNICKLIAKENIIDGIFVTVSIGLTQYLDSDDENSLFKRVDNLMYKSKREGKNRVSSDQV